MEQLKKKSIRNTEYYGTTEIFDTMYKRSSNGNNFKNLIELMSNEGNIRLAYRNIKRNTGSKTAGTDGLTIKDIEILPVEEVIRKVQTMFVEYRPSSVRRVFIPKPNGDKRPLGIPTIWDRIFQQCILQILDPIMEAKFHNHSYGFRSNRSTHHALARMNFLINQAGYTQCVDVDIKGFFDNVNHGKLLKQLWTLGIRDKKLLKIISLLLKSEIEGEGIPEKGTPQGGILSPLLSNVVLNELDWWISDQWETFKTKKKYHKNGEYRALRSGSNLKEMFIIRYADDFKILCRTRSEANRIYLAVEQFLKERLHLETSKEKSKVINLKRKNSEFLGFSIRAIKKGKTKHGIVSQTNMTEKAIKNATSKIRECIIKIQKKPLREAVHNFNSTVIGIQNYYAKATNVAQNLSGINYKLHKVLYNRLDDNRTEATINDMSPTLKKRYAGYKPKLYKTNGMVYVPIFAQKYSKTMAFSQDICNYSVNGRSKIHANLKLNPALIRHISKNFIPSMSIEYNDNRITKFIAQHGRCAVSGTELGYDDWHCHHITPKKYEGDDSYRNLTVLHKIVHKLIHMTNIEKIKAIILTLELNKNGVKKINELRTKARMDEITI